MFQGACPALDPLAVRKKHILTENHAQLVMMRIEGTESSAYRS